MNEFRLVLLSPVQFNENFGVEKEKIIIKSNETKDISKIFDMQNDWDFLDGSEGYLKDSDGSLNITESINKERNLDLYSYRNLTDKNTASFNDTNIEYTAYLLSDKNCNFFIVYDFQFHVKESINADDFLKSILDDRNIFKNLNILDFKDTVQEKSLTIINNILNKLLLRKKPPSNRLKFTTDSSYPLLIINGFDLKKAGDIFKNEEDVIQRSTRSDICDDYGENSFLHIGWNYGVLNNLPKNINQKMFCMMIHLQINYYQLRFYKLYFQKKIQHQVSNTNIDAVDIAAFDKLKISYHKHILDYRTYKSGLYPKIYKEFNSIENLWHILDDVDFINEIFEVQNEYINKTYQTTLERNGRKINAGLSIIAFLQIAAIYGIAKDLLELHQDYAESWFTYTNYGVLFLLVILSPFTVFPVARAIRQKIKSIMKNK